MLEFQEGAAERFEDISLVPEDKYPVICLYVMAPKCCIRQVVPLFNNDLGQSMKILTYRGCPSSFCVFAYILVFLNPHSILILLLY